MKRNSLIYFTRAGVSMTTLSLAMASILSLTGCGSTGGSMSKTLASTGSSGTSTNGTAGTAGGTGSTGSTGTGSGASGNGTSTSPTTTGTGTGSSGTEPVVTGKEASISTWDNVVGGLGNVVKGGGNTVSAVGQQLGVPVAGQSGGVIQTALSSVVTGAGGTVYGIGDGLTNGLEGLADNKNPADSLATTLGTASGQPGSQVSLVGDAVTATGATMPLAGLLSPTTSALGSSIYTTGVNLSSLQNDSNDMLTGGIVQQLTETASPLLLPTITAVIEVGSALGSRTGLGGPLDRLLTGTGNGVTLLGSSLALGSSSPVLQQTGITVAAVGDTVAALGGLVHDGQSTTITPIAASSSGANGIMQGGSGSAQYLPGGSTGLAAAAGTKVVVTSLINGVTSLSPTGTPTGVVSGPLGTSSQVTSVLSAVVAPIVSISGISQTSTTGQATAASQPALLAPLTTALAIGALESAPKLSPNANLLATGVARAH